MSPFENRFAADSGKGNGVHDKVIRVLKIAWMLQTGHHSVDDLADRFGVSRRTIYRDLKLIDEADLATVAREVGGGLHMTPPRPAEHSFAQARPVF